MSLKGIKLITFDATNTLLKFKSPPWEYYACIATDYGFKGTGEEIKSCMLSSYKTTWSQHPNFGRDTIEWPEWWRKVVTLTLKNKVPSKELNNIANTLIQDFKTTKCWECNKGADQILKNIKEKGINIGVISNFDPRLHEILQNVDIHKYFDFVLTSYEVGYAKPDVRIFEKALEQCGDGVTPEESLHIGDDVEKDLEGAQSANWKAVLITKATEKPLACKHVFKTLDELSLAVENGPTLF
ncbi:hypothetical protein JYU34_020318 [Plutella xylostella]|uniref:Uncharacterized protein n=1 Tax=Plutella xylostella TaxID=51655 RepID=A0ABQ7PUF8_PLUXY|nr:hypothetical protein JYU34_020318 [Plutella xylostella]